MAIWEGFCDVDPASHPRPGSPNGHCIWLLEENGKSFEADSREQAIAKVLDAATEAGYEKDYWWRTVSVRQLDEDGVAELDQHGFFHHCEWHSDYDSDAWDAWAIKHGGQPGDLDALAEVLGFGDRTYMGKPPAGDDSEFLNWWSSAIARGAV